MAELKPDAAASGTFTLGGDLTVNRMGFGAMRITGQGHLGRPEGPGGGKARSSNGRWNWASTLLTRRTLMARMSRKT